MGRANRKNLEVQSLRRGLDASGQEVMLGEKDSAGEVVGWIDQDGACFVSLEERDRLRAEEAIEASLEKWRESALDGPMPRPSEIIKDSTIGNLSSAVTKEIYGNFLSKSLGKEIGYIFWLTQAANGPTEEKECASAALRYAEEMRAALLGARAEGAPSLEEIVQECCSSSARYERAGKVALGIWRAVQSRPLSDDWQKETREMHEPRHPLRSSAGNIVYPSKIRGGEVELQRLTETEAEKEDAKKRLEGLSQQLEGAGFAPLPEEVIEKLAGADLRAGTLEDIFKEEVEVEGVESVELSSRPLWAASFEIQLNNEGDYLEVETTREGVDEARRAGWEIEDLASRSPLFEEEVELNILGASADPEEVKQQALDILAGGEDSDYVKQMRVFGISSETLFREAEEIVLGQREQRGYLVAQAEIFLPEVGQTRVTVSAENKEDALKKVAPLLPGATISA